MGQRDRIHRRRGSYQVVPEELHDESRVLVALLRQGIELCDHVSSKFIKIVMLDLPAMASSKACLANWQAWSGELRIS
jgi:hypothetical protein